MANKKKTRASSKDRRITTDLNFEDAVKKLLQTPPPKADTPRRPRKKAEPRAD
jgi:hypothetical protein